MDGLMHYWIYPYTNEYRESPEYLEPWGFIEILQRPTDNPLLWDWKYVEQEWVINHRRYLDRLEAKRIECVTSTVKWKDHEFETTDHFRLDLLTRISLGIEDNYLRLKEGDYILLTVAELNTLSNLITGYVVGCYNKEKEVYDNTIQGSYNLALLDNGWPETVLD